MIEDQSYGDKYNVCTSCGLAATCTYTYVLAKEDLQRISHVETRHAWRGCQWNTVSFTQCMHVHESVSHCEGIFTYSAVRNNRPNSLQVVQKLSE